jgi:flavin-dependent dehydrogenase
MDVDPDIVIVGGGPAGSTTALAIAQAAPWLASRVMLLDKARYPRDKPCAGALAGRGDMLLGALGVSADVPSVRIDGVSFQGSEGEAVAAPGRIGRVVRRMDFDHALVRAAASRGVVVRDGVRVWGVHDDEHAGAVVETSEGVLRARVVVGCDGIGSVVRKALGLGAGRLRAQVVEVDTEPVPTDRDRALLHFDASDRSLLGYAWDFPTMLGGRALVCRGVYALTKGGGRSDERPDVGTLLADRLRRLGVDPARCEHKRYAERGYEPASRIARGAMMLAGEAAGIDMATGEGISQAIEYGVLAGRFLVRRMQSAGCGRLALDDWADHMAASRLARDLRIRAQFMRLFCGPARAQTERLITDSPHLLDIGCQLFAAQPFAWFKLGSLVARGALKLSPAIPAAALAFYRGSLRPWLAS